MTIIPSSDGPPSVRPPWLWTFSRARPRSLRWLASSEVESWIDEAQRNMENGFKARPKDIREQYESEVQKTKKGSSKAHLQMLVCDTGGALRIF